MESIGEKLRTKREELGLSVDQIARDTNIAKRYIISLEEEDFDAFPGEPYLVGFLRTYSESIGLVPEEIISLYKNFKIQEQPLPITELLETKKKRPVLVISIIVIIAGLVIGGFFLIPRIAELSENRKIARERKIEAIAPTGVSYNMTDEILERRFFEGDEIIIALEGEEYPVLLASVGENLTIAAPSGDMSLSLGEEKLLDLEGDGRADIKIFVRDIDRNSERRSVIIRFDRFTQKTVASSLGTITSDKEGAPGSAEIAAAEPSLPSLGSATLASRGQKTVTILESPIPKPITLDIIFRGYCLLRYVIDNQAREERYFHKGETFRLEANRQVMLWISNAGSFKARISGRDVDMGRPGEVATKLLTWEKDEETGAYKLQLIPVY